MKEPKIPAMQFYPADWRKDLAVQSLSYHDRGVWFEMLCLMHESEQRGKLIVGGKPAQNDLVARLLGLSRQDYETTLKRLMESGVPSVCETTGAVMCRRMVRDEEIRLTRRRSGQMGGNPVLVKQKVNQITEGEDEVVNGKNHGPTVGHALLWQTESNRLGSDYTAAETRKAFLALQANGFKWAQADWRAGLERQIQLDRERRDRRAPTARKGPNI